MVWYEANATNGMRHVAETFTGGGVRVSTIFLSLDVNWEALIQDRDDPILFETMVFGGVHDKYAMRYRTWEEAEKGHEFVVALVVGSTMNSLS